MVVAAVVVPTVATVAIVVSSPFIAMFVVAAATVVTVGVVAVFVAVVVDMFVAAATNRWGILSCSYCCCRC